MRLIQDVSAVRYSVTFL